VTDSTLIPLDDRFALDPKRQCLIARTSAGDVVFRMYPKEGLTVDAYLTVLTVRGEQYNASGGYACGTFWVSNIRPVEWLMRKPASKAAQTAVTKLVEEAHTEAQRRGHLRTLETHAAHWWALNALERLDKEREEIEARLAELEAESVENAHEHGPPHRRSTSQGPRRSRQSYDPAQSH
jgi:type IV secretory pathway protease TraF